MRIGERIRNARSLLGISQAELARRLNKLGGKTQPPTISRWENGLKHPLPASLDLLSEVLGVDLRGARLSLRLSTARLGMLDSLRGAQSRSEFIGDMLHRRASEDAWRDRCGAMVDHANATEDDDDRI